MSAIADGEAKRSPTRRWLMQGFAVLGVALAFWLLWRGLQRYTFDQIMDSIRAVPATHLALSAFFAACSYVCLTGFDWLAIRYLGHRLPYRKVALASFTSLSLGHSIGFAGLSSGPIRYRFYSHWGLSAADVAQLVVHCGATVALGLLTLGGTALLFTPHVAEALTGYGHGFALAAGALSLVCVGAYLLACAFVRRGLTIRGHTIRLPHWRNAVAQVVVGTVNFSLVAACLYAAVSSVSEASYPQVAATYVTGNLLTLLTHVPGGLGVIEGTVMYLLKGGQQMVGALIVFRVAYFLLPLTIGAATFAITELRFRRRRAAGASGAPADASAG